MTDFHGKLVKLYEQINELYTLMDEKLEKVLREDVQPPIEGKITTAALQERGIQIIIQNQTYGHQAITLEQNGKRLGRFITRQIRFTTTTEDNHD